MREYKLNLYGKEIIVNQDTDGYFIKPDFINEYEKYGTATKPAYEPIIVARKPFKTSVAENIMQYGVGGINIDECRVETKDQIKPAISGGSVGLGEMIKGHQYIPNNLGRFPANTILTYDKTDFDEVCGGFPNTSGSASRYFYCAKASKKDREEGLEIAGFEDIHPSEITGRKVGSAGAKNGGYAGMTETPRKNIHPTVKPVELMQYLVRMVSPKGSIILDCFMGSGSTGKAVMFENRERNANYKFIGIELTKEYLPICEARIDYAINKYEYDFKKELEEAKEIGQSNIFDFIGVD